MKNWQYIGLLVCLSGFPAMFFGAGCTQQDKANISRERESYVSAQAEKSALISTKFIESRVLRKSLLTVPDQISSTAYIGIVNHHILAANLQAHFFASLKDTRQNIKMFIIISPDHFSAGRGITCHEFDYATEFGVVQNDKDTTAKLSELGCVVEDGKYFADEHGVGALLPFVKYYFPNSKVVPIFLHIDYPKDKLENFGKELANVVSDDVFVIISADMSHYLSDELARQNDEQTKSWLMAGDWKQLSLATDANTDSAGAFAMLKGFFGNKKTAFEILDYAVSTDYKADPRNTTSYITGFLEGLGD